MEIVFPGARFDWPLDNAIGHVSNIIFKSGETAKNSLRLVYQGGFFHQTFRSDFAPFPLLVPDMQIIRERRKRNQEGLESATVIFLLFHFKNIWSVKLFPNTNSNFTPIQQICYYSLKSWRNRKVASSFLNASKLDYHMQNRDSPFQLAIMNCRNEFVFTKV